MVLMKNSAKAWAPAAVCLVATTGMTGGFSPLRVFGPVRGTSAGTVGRRPGGGEVVCETGEVEVGGVEGCATVVCGGVMVRLGVPPLDDVHAAQSAARNAAIARVERTIAILPDHRPSSQT